MHAYAEAQICCYRHVRIQRIGLKHHRDFARARYGVGDINVSDFDTVSRDIIEPGNLAQQRQLTAAGWADEADELAIRKFKIDAMNGCGRAEFFLDPR